MERNHHGVDNPLIEGIAANTNAGEGRIRKRRRGGGLLKYYSSPITSLNATPERAYSDQRPICCTGIAACTCRAVAALEAPSPQTIRVLATRETNWGGWARPKKREGPRIGVGAQPEKSSLRESRLRLVRRSRR